MTYKTMISIPENLKECLDLYNKKNGFKSLSISQMARYGIFEIISQDPEIMELFNKLDRDKESSISIEPDIKEIYEDKIINETELICQLCGKPYFARSRKSKFCSDACKSKAYRQRKTISNE